LLYPLEILHIKYLFAILTGKYHTLQIPISITTLKKLEDMRASVS